MNSGVYRITRVQTGKTYVGSSKNLSRRLGWHRKSLERGSHHAQHLQRAWDKYGADAFEFAIIELVEQPENLVIREQFWLDHWRAASGLYNSRFMAASNLGSKWSAEDRKKLSKLLRGRTHSPERSAIMSAARKGKKRRPMSPDRKAKISAANKGRKRTTEICEMMSAIRRGKKQPPERAAASAAKCRELAAARRGVKFTPEHRAALSSARKSYFANKKAAQPLAQAPGRATDGHAFDQSTAA